MNVQIQKEYNNLEELLGFYAGREISQPLIPPEHVYFPLTSRCTLKCEMCDVVKFPSRTEDELSTPKVKEIILQIKELGTKHIIFSGGEPFLRKDLLEILEFAASCGIENTALVTNGILLDEQTIERLIKIKLTHITVSLDGLEKTNDSIRGRSTFKKITGNIDKLIFLKHKFSSLLPTVGINFTIMNKNIEDMLDMVKFAKKKKYNAIIFQPVLFSNISMYEKKTSILWPSQENLAKLEKIVSKLIKLKTSKFGLDINTDISILKALPDYFKGEKLTSDFKCYEAIKRLVITCAGKVWSCMGIYGDLKENSLKEIWFSEEAMEVRKKIKYCNAHCLQDCVYLPSDIIGKTKSLLRKVSDTEAVKTEFEIRLLDRLEYYSTRLGTEKDNETLGLIKKDLVKELQS